MTRTAVPATHPDARAREARNEAAQHQVLARFHRDQGNDRAARAADLAAMYASRHAAALHARQTA